MSKKVFSVLWREKKIYNVCIDFRALTIVWVKLTGIPVINVTDIQVN